MRRAIRTMIELAAAVCVVAALVLSIRSHMPDKERISLAETSLEAADDLTAAYQNGRDSLLFHSEAISEEEVYHLIQAGEPYLSTLSTAAYQNGTLELTLDIPHRKEQDAGLEQARQAGKEAAAGAETITGKLQAIHDALIRSCVYEESGDDRAQMAAGVSEDGTAVCAGYARAFCAMCDGAGLDAYYIEDDDMTHAWNAVRLYGTTYFIDCTYDDPVPDGGQKVGQTYFMLTAEELAETHTWDKALYEDYLNSRYPENFAYMQRMQDLLLADAGLRAADTDKAATQEELDTLNDLLGTTLADAVSTEDADGETTTLTKGELYKMGYEALWDEVDGERRIEGLIENYTVPLIAARQMGF